MIANPARDTAAWRPVLDLPTRPLGKRKVERDRAGRNELVSDGSGRAAAKDAGEREELPAQLVAVGRLPRAPTPPLPFHDQSDHLNVGGRINGSPNEYHCRVDQAYDRDRGPTRRTPKTPSTTLIKNLGNAKEGAGASSEDHADQADWLRTPGRSGSRRPTGR